MTGKRIIWNKETAFAKALEFENKKEFKTQSGAYEYLRKNGWIGESCSHMTKQLCNHSKWNYESCKTEALKYNTLFEFRKKNETVYNISRKNKWIDNITKHFDHSNNRKHWTIEMCKNDASTCSSRVEYAKRYPNSYHACTINKWINEVCSNMSPPYSNSVKWNKETCLNLALKYSKVWEFRKKEKCVYDVASSNGWIRDITSHMIRKRNVDGYWNNLDNCKFEALKYKNKTDFMKYSPYVYKFATKMLWLDNICSHMIIIGDRYNRCIYSYEFDDRCVYVGLTHNVERRKRDRNSNKRDAVTKHIIRTGLVPQFKQLTEYIPVNDAIKLERMFLENYINDGWISLNRIKTGGVGSSRIIKRIN